MSGIRKFRGSSPSKKLACLCLTTALLASSTFSAASAVFAQGRAKEKPTKLARLLGVKQSDLIAKNDGSDLPVSPVEEDNLPGMTAGTDGLTATPRSTSRPDICGATSVENFQGTQGNLSWTHESASGFCGFLSKWHQANFHRKDAEVSSWLFHDFNAPNRNYDLWPFGSIDHGIDAVRAAFHSSHGGMSNNVFFTSLGADWAGTGWNAQSDRMALGGNWNSYGDERLRYVFWDTCNSVMISGGNNPYSTWATRSKGLRFVFGYETVSVDSPDYGKFFWEEWSKGKTFKSAFLDASWRINQYQAPALVAFGATQSEAVNRRETERTLFADAVSNSWAAWSWYDARRSARTSGLEAFSSASDAQRMEVSNRSNSNEEVAEIAQAFGIRLPDAGALKSRPADIKLVRTDAATLVAERNGNFELRLDTKEDAPAAAEVLSDEALIARAEELVGALSFTNGQNLQVGLIRDLNDNEGAAGFTDAARITEKTVVFDQMLNGTPFIDPEAGHLEITFGARTGKVKQVRSTLKAVTAVANTDAATQRVLSISEARAAALGAFNKAADSQTLLTAAAEVVEGSEAVGYQMIDGQAVLVYRALIKSAAAPGMRPFQALIPLSQ